MKPLNAEGLSSGLARVRLRFIDELQVRRSRLIELRSQLDDQSQCSEAMKEIGHINHKIAGTAETLGFPSLGASAAAIDNIIDKTKAWPTGPDPALLNQIDSIISEMNLTQEKGDCA
ncbi:Hpt domain-containing protein [Rhodobacteraceae bacterium KMM 6894]|nr:Hpt domain-containing protein [Rhodobacteraceae bacterium KMM 6894]